VLLVGQSKAATRKRRSSGTSLRRPRGTGRRFARCGWRKVSDGRSGLCGHTGAYPGIESEERGVAEAIAVNLREMMLLDTPIVSW